MKAFAITTSDNPYDPFDDFDEWYAYDERHGYHSCAYLDRSCYTSDSLSDEENLRNIEEGIDNIIGYTPIALYVDGVNDVYYVKVEKEIDS